MLTLLGVCEVENRFVLELLVAALQDPLPTRRYEIVHADTDDARGIDVAFIYDQALFEVHANEVRRTGQCPTGRCDPQAGATTAG